MRTLALTSILSLPDSMEHLHQRAESGCNDQQRHSGDRRVCRAPRSLVTSGHRAQGGTAVGLNIPPSMFANGSVGQGGRYDRDRDAQFYGTLSVQPTSQRK